MWKLWVQVNIVFLVLLTAVLSGVFAMNGRQPDWLTIGAFGVTATLPFAVGTYIYLAGYHRERVRKHRAYWTEMQEIVDELARNSLTERSVFMSALQRGDDGSVLLVTSQDNPNHQALEQMANLGIAKLISSEATGVAPGSALALRYRFDFKGLGLLFSLVEAAAKRRDFFDRTSQLKADV